MIKQFCIYSVIELARFNNSMSGHLQFFYALVTGRIEEAEKHNLLHLELTKAKLAEVLAEKRGEKRRP